MSDLQHFKRVMNELRKHWQKGQTESGRACLFWKDIEEAWTKDIAVAISDELGLGYTITLSAYLRKQGVSSPQLQNGYRAFKFLGEGLVTRLTRSSAVWLANKIRLNLIPREEAIAGIEVEFIRNSNIPLTEKCLEKWARTRWPDCVNTQSQRETEGMSPEAEEAVSGLVAQRDELMEAIFSCLKVLRGIGGSYLDKLPENDVTRDIRNGVGEVISRLAAAAK